MRYDVIIRAGSAGCALATCLPEDPSRSVPLPGWRQIIRSSTACLPEDLKWGGKLWMSAFGPRNWGDLITATL